MLIEYIGLNFFLFYCLHCNNVVLCLLNFNCYCQICNINSWIYRIKFNYKEFLSILDEKHYHVENKMKLNISKFKLQQVSPPLTEGMWCRRKLKTVT